MSKLLRPVLLPVVFFLFFTAEECDSPDSIEEEVTVLPDGTVETRFQHKAEGASRILDSDPPPSLEVGWDSVHLGLMRENDDDLYYLRAWTRFAPGSELPGSYARPEDPLADWYVQFPSELVRSESGDTVSFNYRRTYPALPWSPMGLFEDLEENLQAVEEELEALEEGDGGEFEEKWEVSGLKERAEEEGDSATLRQYQREFRDLFESGEPPWIETYRRLYSGWIQLSLLSDIAPAIPAGEAFCRENHLDPIEVITDVLLGAVAETAAPPELTWMVLLEEAELEPDPAVFPDVNAETLDLWDDGLLQELSTQTLARVREALRRECDWSAKDGIEFDRRFSWFADRYRISDGELRDQRFELYLRMPGELVETNADTIIDGRAEWGFSIRDLFKEDVTVIATSRLIKRNP